MRKLIVLLVFTSGIVWTNSNPVYYFIVGPEVARLPSYLRMTSGDTEQMCTLFLRDWERTFPLNGAYCERVIRSEHWFNAIRNIAWKIDSFASEKQSVSQKY